MESFTIRNLFNLADRFEIPEYQRAYSWEKEQFNQFVNDIKECTGTYYLGHYLLECRENDETYYIIDGQQRMTTVVIFMSCIVRALKSRLDLPDSFRVSTIERTYLINNEDSQRFHTVHYDGAFFNKEIIENTDRNHAQYAEENSLPSTSQLNIRHCREFFDELLKGITTEEILRWYTLVNQANITYYLVRSKIEAAQIFAFQNDRGKKLTNLEVIKSYFMLQIYLRGGKKQNDYIVRLEDAYQRMYKEIVHISISEDAVLRYFWMGYSNKGFNVDNVLDEIKNHFHTVDVSEILAFLDQLAQSFEYVTKFEKSSDLYPKYLRKLNLMGWSYPVLLNARVYVGASETTMYKLMQIMENITFRAMVRGGRASVESRLNSLIIGVNDEDHLLHRMHGFIADVTNSYWSDSQFRTALRNGYIYHRKVACAYLLWRYEESLVGKGYVVPLFSIPKESIEHIAPQHPKEGDIANGYGIYVDSETPENGIESGEWLSSIGNLMLVSGQHNSSLGNKNFSNKVIDYGVKNLLLQQKEIHDQFDNVIEPVWDVQCIKERGGKIITAAMDIWNMSKIL